MDDNKLNDLKMNSIINQLWDDLDSGILDDLDEEEEEE